VGRIAQRKNEDFFFGKTAKKIRRESERESEFQEWRGTHAFKGDSGEADTRIRMM